MISILGQLLPKFWLFWSSNSVFKALGAWYFDASACACIHIVNRISNLIVNDYCYHLRGDFGV